MDRIEVLLNKLEAEQGYVGTSIRAGRLDLVGEHGHKRDVLHDEIAADWRAMVAVLDETYECLKDAADAETLPDDLLSDELDLRIYTILARVKGES